ncbi:hypothetical protein Jab_1c14500 [Janthinobacterium sp. HH01]|uniref:polysaccharide lyase n=1 Tax=Janthinobacterium sp. HH01 TaxID=1198452 RepID=UPI0002AEDD0B|nr:polysaccharide lyase [Janthinobacterium sp. HH01]ELX12835.1 hypothetical protein Jab_1c14500 [Janthinobacterium sp. HH01]
MHIPRLMLSMLLLGAGDAAQAQIATGLGGKIDTDTPAPPQYVKTDAPNAIAYNSNSGNTRYIDSVYTLNSTNSAITWTDQFDGAAQAGHKVFRAQVFKPAEPIDENGKSVVARGEVSPRWDYTPTGVRWYAISVYIPHGWAFNNAEMLIGQLHTSQKVAIVSPPVGLAIQGNYLKLALQASELTVPNLDKSTASSQSIRLAAIDADEARNKWYCFVMRADWSPTPGVGSFKLWMNGKLMYQAQNAFNSYVTDLGNYAKTGLYVPGTSAMPDSQTVYTDYVYLAGPATTNPADLIAMTPCRN